MAQPPVPGRGAGAEPGPGAGARLPGGDAGGDAAGRRGRDPRLAGFAQGGPGDTCPPGSALAVTLEELSGPDWRCPGATDDELVGLLGRWQAVESRAAAGKLGVVRELIRRRARPGVRGQGVPMHGDLPDAWEEGLGHEISAGLAVSLRSADQLTGLAWDLGARLPGIGGMLAGGTIDLLKARVVADELGVLDDEQAAAAEKLILGELAGKTPGQVGRLAAQAVCTVDPDGARKRREQAERDEARVRFWRENTGTSALAAYGLPTDAALAANAAIGERAGEYKKAKASPGATMDQLRVLAYLDLLNGVSAAARIARAGSSAGAAQGGGEPEGSKPAGRDARDESAGPGGVAGGVDGDRTGDCSGSPGCDSQGDGGPGHGPHSGHGRGSGFEGDGGSGPYGDGSSSPGSDGGSGPHEGLPGDPSCGQPGGPAPSLAALAARANLTIPLVTLLGLAERPGAGHGLGPLDPALARDLAAAAAASPHSEWCVTVTDASGVAIGHGCARAGRNWVARNAAGGAARTRGRSNRADSPPPGSRDGPWAFTRRAGPDPPDGFGSWALTLPGGRELTVKLGPVPVTGCDHRHESRGYEPNDTLRHLVEIRDGECTFPPCSRHARGCDFEHAIPYDQGGRTCACNAGARSRRCHQVKQSRGWTVTQPRPGWHQWTTPAGRSYTQGPMQYPA